MPAESRLATGALLLLLLDSRSPAGAHNHSAGMEAAITTGLVHDLADVEDFCRNRLRTAGRVAADFAAAAATLGLGPAAATLGLGPAAAQHADADAATGPRLGWRELDAEFDARTPSEALRASSRQLGRGLTRMVRSMLPGFAVPATHHPLVLGAAVAAAGGTPDLAARAAALGTVSVPASGAVRLLGLDPFAVQGMLARLASEIDAPDPVIDRGFDVSWAVRPSVDHERLAANSAPALDLLADVHLTSEVRLFAS